MKATGYQSREEVLARKLVGYLVTAFATLAFAAGAFTILSRPPEDEETPAPQGAEQGEPLAADAGLVQACRDRLAQIQLSDWPLAERMAEAKRLLGRSPTAELRRQVEKLVGDLGQEQRFEQLAALEAVRRQATTLGAQKQFAQAEAAIGAFARDHPDFVREAEELTAALRRQRDRAFEDARVLAEQAIARGEVETATKLSREAIAFASDAERPAVLGWASRAEERRAKGVAGTEVAAGAEEPAVAKAPPAEEAPPVEEGPGQPEAPPPPAGASAPFTGFAAVTGTAAPSGVAATVGDEKVTIDLARATVLLDEVVPAAALSETLRRGMGLWVLGTATRKQVVMKPFGRTMVRQVDNVGLVFIAGEVLPDPMWEDPSLKGRTWRFGLVELAFPILRIAMEDESFLVLPGAAPFVRRTKPTEPPTIPAGARLLVVGTRQGARIAAERAIVLAAELADLPAYAKSCQ
jgi:hypothetical protein